MNRFFSTQSNIFQNTITIVDYNQAHHIRDVLRLKPKDKLTIVDKNGNEYDCIIEKIQNTITLQIKNKRLSVNKQNKINLTIACAIPKKSNMSDIVDKLTQLGVDRIIPLKTERVVVKLDKHKESLLHERWKRIALSASQQSQRTTVPAIDVVSDIKKVILGSKDYDLKLIPTLPGKRKFLKDALNSKPKNILVLIGPEGDFADEEIDLAKRNGFVAVSLGESVLRVETAAVTVASFIKLYLSPQ